MLRSLFRALSSQSNQKAAPVPLAANCIDPAQLKLVAGGEGLPRGGWPMSAAAASSGLPRGGWL